MKMEKCNGSLDENVLTVIEQFWGYKLPVDYRKFLLETNGGMPRDNIFRFRNKEGGSCVVDFFGLINDFNNNILLKEKYSGSRVPSNMLAIARDVYGNLILLAVKNPDRGKIYFWDHEIETDPAQDQVPDYSNLTLIADNFNEFLEGLYSNDETA